MEEKPNSGVLDRIRRFTNNIVNQSTHPTEQDLGYKSTVGVYGGELRIDPDGKMIFDTQNPTAIFDRLGDRILRTYDPHLISQPLRMLLRKPGSFFHHLIPTPDRQRGSNKRILENISRLGLTDYYGPHPRGIEVKKPEVIKKGIALQDILRAGQINSPLLNKIDRLQAINAAAGYIRFVHDQYGPIGEIHVSDILFQDINENGVVSNPVLNIPDIVFNPKQATHESQKAIDLMDILINITTEELKGSPKPEQISLVLEKFLEGYQDPNVIKIVKSFIKRGRPNIEHFLLSQHNQVRLGAKPQNAATIKKHVIDALEKFLKPN